MCLFLGKKNKDIIISVLLPPPWCYFILSEILTGHTGIYTIEFFLDTIFLSCAGGTAQSFGMTKCQTDECVVSVVL